MKKTKQIVIKTVATTVAAGVVIPSCTSDYDSERYNFNDSYYGSHTENHTRGISLYDIQESNLSGAFQHKLQAIQQIVDAILSDNREARRFAKNPNEYIESKEMHFNIVLHETERRLLQAFADDEVLKAVKTNDAETFLSLCIERGYIGIMNEYNKPENIREIFKTDEDYEAFLHLIENVNDYDTTTRAVAALPIYVVAGAVFYMGAATIYGLALSVVITIEAGVLINAAALVNEAVAINSETNNRRIEAMKVNEPVLRIWTENNGMIGDDIFYTEIMDKQINLFMDLIEKEFVLSQPAFDSIRNILRIQLEGYYGFRK